MGSELPDCGDLENGKAGVKGPGREMHIELIDGVVGTCTTSTKACKVAPVA